MSSVVQVMQIMFSLNEKNSYNDFQDESFNNSSSILEESLFEKSKSDDIEPGDSLYKIT